LVMFQKNSESIIFCNLHTYKSNLIPEGISEASQIFLRDAHVLPK
jgi:hypothetical protein